MFDLARLVGVVQASGQSLGQPQLRVDRLRQQRAAIGARVGLIKLGSHGLVKNLGKEQALCYSWVLRQKASSRVESCVTPGFCHKEVFCVQN
jgi:hypothetical protein